MILLVMLLGLTITPLALADDFPLRALNGIDLVADSDTQYITVFAQNPTSKLITATVQVYHGGKIDEDLVLGGAGLEITFNNKIAPSSSTGSDIFSIGSNTSSTDFATYCTTLESTFSKLGATYIERSASSGGVIGAKISNTESKDMLEIEPGQTKSIIKFYFMPLNGADRLDLDMFSYSYQFTSNLVRLVPWLGNGSIYLEATATGKQTTETYAVNPAAFKIHVQRPQPNVSSNDGVVSGWDAENMEWSTSQSGAFSSSTAPTFSNEGQTIYVRAKGTAYSGSDGMFENYKRYLPSTPVALTYNGGGATPIEVTVTFDPNDGTISGDSSKKVTVGETYGALPSANRNGYRFLGWFTEKSGGSLVEATTTVTIANDHTLFAHWAQLITVTFDATDGQFTGSGSPKTATKVYAVGIDHYDMSDPVLYGHVFDGWWTTEKTGGERVPYGTLVTKTANHTLYARWKEATGNEVAVIFDKNYTPSPTIITTVYVEKGKTVGNVIPVPYRTGFSFLSWNTKTDGSGTTFTKDTIVTDEITVYAQWRENAPPGGGIPGIPSTGTTVFIPDINTPLAGFTSDHIPFLNGYPDGSVKPDSPITRAEVAMIFFRLLSSPDKNTPRVSGFSDVPDTQWYAQAVSYLTSINILTGYPEGDFRPQQPITRAEFAAVASRFDSLTPVSTNAFPDIEIWAKDYINSAYAKGWVSGYPDGTFKPQQNITRAEVVKVVNTMLNRKVKLEDIPAGIKHFTDAEGHWAYTEIVEASNDHNYTRKTDGFEIWTLK